MRTATYRFDVVDVCVEKLEELLFLLELDFQERHHCFEMRCPIHDGIKKTSVNIYKNTGIWNCFTRGCHNKWGKSIIGFVRGVLSARENREYNFRNTTNFLIKHLSINASPLTKVELEKRRYISDSRKLFSPAKSENGGLTREEVRSRLRYPAEYYLKRGFPEQILDEYDIGFCDSYGKPMYRRVVVPIYDEIGRLAVGFTGRATDDNYDPKWLNSKGFNKTDHLFNFWKAKSSIEETNTAILCEGIGDVLRLEQAGIKNSVALFGAELSDKQSIILERSGAFNLVVVTDKDSAGERARKTIAEKCGRLYNLCFPKFSAKDIGEMGVSEIQAEIRPFI